jgi:ribonuclease HI
MTTTNSTKPPVVIYTDGACSGNPGPGGWGVHMNNGKTTKDLCGGELDTTNNRMELMAAIKALEKLAPPRRISLHSDSTYVIKGMTEWLPQWIARNWRKGSGLVSNVDLWQRLQTAAQKHDVSWHWVKGHAGDPGNTRADALANQGLELTLQKARRKAVEHV